MTFSPTLFAHVHGLIADRYQVFKQEREDGSAFLYGRFGDVSVEVFAEIVDDLAIVRVTTNVARRVPLTNEVVATLSEYNGVVPFTVLGIADDDIPETVRVRASSSTFGESINGWTVINAIETCAWPANALLGSGFLKRYGGDSAYAVESEQIAEAAELVGNTDVASNFRSLAAELRARAQEGALGRLPG